jgi:prepilin-type processing-associated H-X9-DG protein
VVIAIIALLVSMLMPSLKQAKEMARTVACASSTRGQGVALYYYAEDHDDYMPARRHGWEKFWADDLLHYTGPGTAFTCPSSTGSNANGTRPKDWRGSQGNIGPFAGTCDYAMNVRAFGVGGTPGTYPWGDWPRLSERWEHSVTKEHMPKQTTMILGEGRLRKDQRFRSYWESGEYIYESGLGMYDSEGSEMTQRHLDGGANNVFADGHVDFVHYDDLLQHGEYWGPDIAYSGMTPGHGPYDD